jgi:hypothetical protein
MMLHGNASDTMYTLFHFTPLLHRVLAFVLLNIPMPLLPLLLVLPTPAQTLLMDAWIDMDI